MHNINSFEDYQKIYAKSVGNPEEFWAEVADDFVWRKKWDTVLEWDFHKPEAKWFNGAKLNITENCLDRHLEKRGDQVAIIWEPNNPAHEPVRIHTNNFSKKSRGQRTCSRQTEYGREIAYVSTCR